MNDEQESLTNDLARPPKTASSLSVRVSSACNRCRRNRSRCDTFRPCSLCLRGNAQCISTPVAKPNHPSKRQKISKEETRQVALAQSPRGTESVAASDGDTHSSKQRSTSPSRQKLDDVGTINYAEADSTMGIARKIFLLGDHSIKQHITSAIPDGHAAPENPLQSPQTGERTAIDTILGWKLPPLDVIMILLEEYFESVHYFSLVISEPKFRLQLSSILDGNAGPSQKGFLILLSTVLALASLYRSQRYCPNEPPETKEMWNTWRSTLFQHVESQIIDVMDRNTLSSIQTCVLLGTYYVYHGRPNLSLSLLGATIKASQAIGLHRASTRSTFNDVEERKRVWWTIYVWDRFASITYGRPLGINDEDCNVAMPSDFEEIPTFQTNYWTQEQSPICYSAYQREVNTLYMIASPMIETIFGIRSARFASHTTESHYSILAQTVSQRLREWKSRLPKHLICNLNHDVPKNASPATKAHQLQALALQLTFDNIIVVLYRPVLAQQMDQLSNGSPSETRGTTGQTPDKGQLESGPTRQTQQNSGPPQTEQWWSAAVRTSQVTELPQLAQLATDSHLMAFLAINLFHSAIVMVVCALSDPLSDRAQETKRNITRIYRLQVLLGQRSQLSMQSSIVLQDVIKLLLARETEAMLSPAVLITIEEGPSITTTAFEQGADNISVGDTLRLPLNMSSAQLRSDFELQEDDQAMNNQLWRLNESLASVQRVLPGVQPDEYYSVENGNGTSSQQVVDRMNGTPRAGETNMEWDQMNYGGDSSAGLYWMWNTFSMPNSLIDEAPCDI